MSSTARLFRFRRILQVSLRSCNIVFKGYNAIMDGIVYLMPFLEPLFSVTECAAIGHYAAAIAIMDIVWLWYIYKLDRGYFQYVFFDKPLFRALSTALVPIGAVLGMLVGFSPNLCVVPITAIGVWMAGLLLAVARQNDRTSKFGELNWESGKRTAIDMVLTTLLMVNLHSFMVSTMSVYVDARQAMESERIFSLASPAITIFWGTCTSWCGSGRTYAQASKAPYRWPPGSPNSTLQEIYTPPNWMRRNQEMLAPTNPTSRIDAPKARSEIRSRHAAISVPPRARDRRRRMRGVVAAGMVTAIQELGLTGCFDTIHGSSAGACAGAYLMTDQARLGTSIFYEDINNSRCSILDGFGAVPPSWTPAL